MALPAAPFTEMQYAAREERADYRSEYVNGGIFAVAGGTLAHSRLCARAGRLIGNQLPDHCEAYESNLRIRVRATGLQTYPDVSVVCGPPCFWDERTDCIENPVVLVEVLCAGTIAYDRGAKLDHYKQIESLREYVIVYQTRARVETYRRTVPDQWIMDAAEGACASIDLTSVGVTLCLDDLYRSVDLPGLAW